MNRLLSFIGTPFLKMSISSGNFLILFVESIIWLFRPPFRWRIILKQMEFIGVNSIFVVILTGTFTGMVFSFQSYIGFHKFGAEYMVGTVVGLGMARELWSCAQFNYGCSEGRFSNYCRDRHHEGHRTDWCSLFTCRRTSSVPCYPKNLIWVDCLMSQ